MAGLLGSKNGPADPLSGLDPALLMRAGKVLSGLNDGPDDRCQLLFALKPYLRRERQGRVDEAIALLKLMRVAELFRKDLL